MRPEGRFFIPRSAGGCPSAASLLPLLRAPLRQDGQGGGLLGVIKLLAGGLGFLEDTDGFFRFAEEMKIHFPIVGWHKRPFF